MFRIYFVISLVLLTIFAVGCSESDKDLITNGDNKSTTSADLGKQFYIRVGQTESVEPGNIQVKLIKVTDDSRCPSDVTCIWAGEVKVVLNITIDGEDSGETILTLGANNNDDQNVKNIGGYYVKVIAVNPYPVSTKIIGQSDYIVTLIVNTTIDEQVC